MTDFSLDDFLPYQLAVIAEAVSREFSADYRDRFGLSRADWRVIVHVWAAGPVSVREVHARVDMHKSKVSRAASRLEAAGLIRKAQNSDDRRLLRLTLTGKGREMMDALLPLASAYEEKLLSRLGADAPAFRDMLDRLLRATP